MQFGALAFFLQISCAFFVCEYKDSDKLNGKDCSHNFECPEIWLVVEDALQAAWSVGPLGYVVAPFFHGSRLRYSTDSLAYSNSFIRGSEAFGEGSLGASLLHTSGSVSGFGLDSDPCDSNTPVKLSAARTCDSDTPPSTLLGAKTDAGDSELGHGHSTPRRGPAGARTGAVPSVIEETPNGSKVVHI
uniref:Uncharacterized protein n=1 Tax=Florenciella parvula TaxID=236787 RepID=A0A7S2BLX3_9STRA